MLLTIFSVVVLIMSAVIHEYMHGFAADQLGDDTARNAGRLTLNPIPHIDPIGSIFLPLLLALSGSGFIIGWAKPVPFNPYNLRGSKYGPVKVALAGPLGNIIVAVFFGIFLRFAAPFLNNINPLLIQLFASIVFINLLLAIFNLVPIPPLDGSRIFSVFLPVKMQEKLESLSPYSMILVFIFVAFLFPVVLYPTEFLFRLITGI